MYWTDEMWRTDEMRRADVRRNSGGRVLLIFGFGTGDADEMERTYSSISSLRESISDMSSTLYVTKKQS